MEKKLLSSEKPKIDIKIKEGFSIWGKTYDDIFEELRNYELPKKIYELVDEIDDIIKKVSISQIEGKENIIKNLKLKKIKYNEIRNKLITKIYKFDENYNYFFRLIGRCNAYYEDFYHTGLTKTEKTQLMNVSLGSQEILKEEVTDLYEFYYNEKDLYIKDVNYIIKLKNILYTK